MQRTLKKQISFVGIGLHSGRPARMLVLPATDGYGIKFRRTDIKDVDNFVAAIWHGVHDTRLSTNIRNSDAVTVSTIEHIMAALAGCGITNALIDIDGPEIPIMDGSAAQFVEKIVKTGTVDQSKGFVWQVQQKVSVQEGEAFASVEPCDGYSIDFSIQFEKTIIGAQQFQLDMAGGNFVSELANCRTFCKNGDVEAMQAQGLALGGSYDNALVVEGQHYLNPEGPRRVDECVRHKMLDSVGDLALAGAPILGKYIGTRAGHRMTNLLLRKIFSTKDAVVKVPVTDAIISQLPGLTKQENDLLRVG